MSKVSPVFRLTKPPLSVVATKPPIKGLSLINPPHDVVRSNRLATGQLMGARLRRRQAMLAILSMRRNLYRALKPPLPALAVLRR
jgi:hypothetical protein